MRIRRFTAKLTLALGMGSLAFALPVGTAADPEPKAAPAVPDKPADWSKFVTVGEIHGEVIKSDDSGFTLRVTWYAPKGGTNNRPRLGSGNNNNYRRSGGGQRPPQMVEQHHDYMLKFADNGQVRQLKLPPKTDDKGKKVDYSVKEIENAKKPAGMPYYAAGKADLVPGASVEVMLVRPREIPASKAQESDLQVKFAVIHAVGKAPAASDGKK